MCEHPTGRGHVSQGKRFAPLHGLSVSCAVLLQWGACPGSETDPRRSTGTPRAAGKPILSATAPCASSASSSPTQTAYRRGAEVVVRTDRGQEVGEVLCAATRGL